MSPCSLVLMTVYSFSSLFIFLGFTLIEYARFMNASWSASAFAGSSFCMYCKQQQLQCTVKKEVLIIASFFTKCWQGFSVYRKRLGAYYTLISAEAALMCYSLKSMKGQFNQEQKRTGNAQAPSFDFPSNAWSFV